MDCCSPEEQFNMTHFWSELMLLKLDLSELCMKLLKDLLIFIMQF